MKYLKFLKFFKNLIDLIEWEREKLGYPIFRSLQKKCLNLVKWHPDMCTNKICCWRSGGQACEDPHFCYFFVFETYLYKCKIWVFLFEDKESPWKCGLGYVKYWIYQVCQAIDRVFLICCFQKGSSSNFEKL